MSPIYFDNAATSFPKPTCVIKEVERCLKYYCGNPGRSSHRLAMEAAARIYDCRERLSDSFSSPSPDMIVFTQNATYALNMAIKGILRRGDHVLISDMEHNAVYRPILSLSGAGLITHDIFETHKDGRMLPAETLCGGIKSKILPGRTKMLICTHIPNVCSSILPIGDIGRLCRENGVIFVLDASQSAGHVPIDMSAQSIDVLCAPAHKGLMGIQGCGFMILGKNVSAETLIEGGSGVDSLAPSMPDDPPERFEAGTLPTPSIVGLSEGVKFLSSLPPIEAHEREKELFLRLREMLDGSPHLGAEIYVPDSPGAVMLLNLRGYDCEDVGRFLSKRGICTRSGYHCAPLAHRTLGTPEGGALRISFGFFNKKSELEPLMKALGDYIKS